MTVAMSKSNRKSQADRVDIIQYNSDKKYRLYIIPCFGNTHELPEVYNTFEEAEQAVFNLDKVFGYTKII